LPSLAKAGRDVIAAKKYMDGEEEKEGGSIPVRKRMICAKD